MEIHIPADFTLGELQAFIEGERTEAVEGFYTAEEWAEHFGIYVKKMRRILKDAKREGLLEITRVTRTTLDDRSYQVPVYALKKRNDEDKE